MIDFRKFNSTSEFYEASRSAGIRFPVTMMGMIEKAMKDLDLNFADTFDVLLKSGAVIPVDDDAFIYSVRGPLTDPIDHVRRKRRRANQSNN